KNQKTKKLKEVTVMSSGRFDCRQPAKGLDADQWHCSKSRTAHSTNVNRGAAQFGVRTDIKKH
ncbi:MAG: hypothetical protein SGJ27_27395, partial [Candidatus Melainabacteria bacterium]|nr:hypothetical protein [Candidatus Melainabacteria bacterium]